MISVRVRSLFSKTFNLLITLIFFSTLVLFTGCEKKTEKQQPAQMDTTTVNKGTDTVTTPAVDTTKKVDLKGKYTGTFDKRPTTLNIKEQDGNKFKGSITINYREVINQQVEGEYNPNSMDFTMKDLLHSRYSGKYKGKFDKDFSSMSGTFTMNTGDSKFSFNLKKK